MHGEPQLPHLWPKRTISRTTTFKIGDGQSGLLLPPGDVIEFADGTFTGVSNRDLDLTGTTSELFYHERGMGVYTDQGVTYSRSSGSKQMSRFQEGVQS